jgi:hypothetical protein
MEKSFSGDRMIPTVTASRPLRQSAPTDGLVGKDELVHHPVESLMVQECQSNLGEHPMLKLIGYSTLVLGLALAMSEAALAVEPTPIVAKAETKHYRLELDIGRMERMYTKAEVAKLHPTDGEIMVSGTMAGMPSDGGNPMALMGDAKSGTTMPMPASPTTAADTGWRHLEVHVISMATDKPVQNAKIKITVTNTATKHHEAVPIVVMYDVEEGVADWHYGNNVMLPSGPYHVDVVTNGEKTVFHVSIPAS